MLLSSFTVNQNVIVITYIVAGLPYSFFQTQYIFSARSLTYEMLRWALLWIMIIFVDFWTLPCQDWVSGHSDLRTDVAIYLITEQSLMPSFISVLSHWIYGVSNGLYCLDMTQYFIWCCGYYCSYIDSCDIYWLVVSWSSGHIYMDLVVYYTMYWCP